LETQKSYLSNESISTIYFGGGTPSLLSPTELESVLEAVYENFEITDNPEVTLEANPENLSAENLHFYKSVGINRLSVGVQSFNDKHLKFLNRSHSAAQAISAIERIRQMGFMQMSLDLIFAIRQGDDAIWESDLKTALDFEPEHLSVYNLTIENGTVFGNWQGKGKLNSPDDDQCSRQYVMAHEKLEAAGYEHYEISNYALPGQYSRHNTAYWRDQKYLGIGPGAHSYNLKSRQFNVKNNALYIKGIEIGQLPATIEQLSEIDKINEMVLTGLRTQWGIDLNVFKINQKIEPEKKGKIDDFLRKGLMKRENDTIKLTLSGQLLADSIISELMI